MKTRKIQITHTKVYHIVVEALDDPKSTLENGREKYLQQTLPQWPSHPMGICVNETVTASEEN